MWETVDKELKKYQKLQLTNERELKFKIKQVFNIGFEFSTLYKYAEKDILSQFKTRLELFKGNYKENDYVSYLANKYIKKTRIKNNEILQILLLIEYAEIYNKNYKEQVEMYKRIGKEIAIKTNKECKKLKPLHKYYNYEDAVIINLLATPNNLGLTWKEHNTTIIEYYSNQVYKNAVVELQQAKELQVPEEILKRQRFSELRYKADRLTDKFYGQIDNEATYLINQERLQIYRYYGISKVIFRAVLDDRTTEECKNLSGKIFNINDLVLGENLPPIHYNCRSYIEAWRV